MSPSSPFYPWQVGVWQRLQQARIREQLPHALLLGGEEGCGNERFVQELAKSLLCLQPATSGYACGHCRSCQVLASRAHPDFLYVTLQDERQAIVVEQVRELGRFLGLSLSYSPCRVVIIAPAERMNSHAANSLLKSLEEPAENTHILLLAREPGQLLPTIRSRCQLMRLPVPSYQKALQWLEGQALQHSAAILLRAARGRPLTALALDTGDTLALHERWLQQVSQVVQGQGDVVALAAQWEKQDRVLLLDWQLGWLTTLIKQREIKEKNIDRDLQVIANACNQEQAWFLYSQLLELKRLVNHPLNSRLWLESLLMLWQVKAC